MIKNHQYHTNSAQKINFPESSLALARKAAHHLFISDVARMLYIHSVPIHNLTVFSAARGLSLHKTIIKFVLRVVNRSPCPPQKFHPAQCVAPKLFRK